MTEHEPISQEVTLDDLARMVARGFKESDIKLIAFKDTVESRFEESDRKLEEFKSVVENGFKESDKKLIALKDYMETRFDSIDERFDVIEKTVFHDHGKRIRRIETKLQIA